MNPPYPWELAGVDRVTWSKLPWRIMRRHLYKQGRMPWYRYHFPTPFIWWRNFSLWWNEPPGGYLFAAWCRHNAEDHTIATNYPHAVFSCGHKPRPAPERPL